MNNPEIAFSASCQTHAFILQRAAGGLLLVWSSAHKYKIVKLDWTLQFRLKNECEEITQIDLCFQNT